MSLLQKNGYTCLIKSQILIGGIKDGWSEELNCDLLKSTFSISEIDNEYIVDYTQANFIQELKIKNVDEVINFIKKTFPISN